MTGAAYCVRADRGIYAEAFRAGGYAAIGWEEVEDLSGIPRGDDRALGALYDAAYPDDGKRRRGLNVGQIRRFLWELEPGDVVVTPMRRSEYLIVGITDSPYYYEVTPEYPHGHRRKVRWLDEPVLRSSLSVPVQTILRAYLTVFKVRPPDELLKAVGREAPTPKP
jgi:restriction system protein